MCLFRAEYFLNYIPFVESFHCQQIIKIILINLHILKVFVELILCSFRERNNQTLDTEKYLDSCFVKSQKDCHGYLYKLLSAITVVS